MKYFPGVAKAWVNSTNSSGTPTMNVNMNVSSVSDPGSGRMGVNLTTAFSSVNYAVIPGHEVSSATVEHMIMGIDTDTTASFFGTSSRSTGGSAVDEPGVSVVFFGDQ
jgi:hypothetical protein